MGRTAERQRASGVANARAGRARLRFPWAKNRRDEPTLYDPNLMRIGDMNVTEADENDKVFRELVRPDMVSPRELYGTAVQGKAEGLHEEYDQIVTYPRQTRYRLFLSTKPEVAGEPHR